MLLGFGDYVLDSERRELRRGASPIAVEPQVFDLLLFLVQQRDRVVSKDDLLQAVWGGRIVSDSALAARINAARKALGDSGEAQRWIRTLPRKGIRFIGAVREEQEPAAALVNAPPTVAADPPRPEIAPPVEPLIAALPLTNLSDDPEQEYFSDGVAAPVASAPTIATLPTPAIAEPPPPPSPKRIRSPLAFAVAAIALVAVAFVGWWTWSDKNRPGSATMTLSGTTPALPLSIVVLPFQNLSGDPEQEYFADGVTDDLTSDLSRIAGSFVISRTTAFTFKGKPIDVKLIGRDLGVRYILEGSVRRSGNQVHVNVHLIDAATEAHIWTDQFDTDRANLVEAQTEIISRLANTLHVALVRDADSRIAEQRRADPNAQDLVMRGRSLRFRTQSGEAQEQAKEAFARALQIDPRSIDAKIGLAWALLTSTVAAVGSLPQPNEARAQGLLQEVLDRDQDNASGHAAMGLLRINQKRFTEARIELETALQLDPNDADAARNLGWTLFYSGEFSAARNQAEKVARLNPRDPYIFSTYDLLGACEMQTGHFAAAAGFYVKSRAANPRIFITHLALAAALAMQGDLDGGKAELTIARKLQPDANSLAIFRDRPCTANPVCREATDKTLLEGLRRLGFPEN